MKPIRGAFLSVVMLVGVMVVAKPVRTSPVEPHPSFSMPGVLDLEIGLYRWFMKDRPVPRSHMVSGGTPAAKRPASGKLNPGAD